MWDPVIFFPKTVHNHEIQRKNNFKSFTIDPFKNSQDEPLQEKLRQGKK